MAIFTEHERKLIDAYSKAQSKEHRDELLSDEAISEKDVIHRLKTEKTHPTRIVNLIQEFVEDIERVQSYYDYVDGNNTDIQLIREELKIAGVYHRWRTILDHWEQLSEGPKRPDEIDESIRTLTDGLTTVDRREDRMEEFNNRVEALFWILKRDQTSDVIDLLRFIRDNSRIEQQQSQEVYQDNQIGSRSWSWYGSRWLGSKHQLIKKHDKSGNKKAYELTDRGGSILRTLEALYESDTIKERAERNNTSVSKTVKDMLAEYPYPRP